MNLGQLLSLFQKYFINTSEGGFAPLQIICNSLDICYMNLGLIYRHRWARVLGQGGVYTGVCPKKILRPPLAAGIFFPLGCQNFFSVGGFISKQGCDFAKK